MRRGGGLVHALWPVATALLLMPRAVGVPVAIAHERTVRAYTTGYSVYDNTPPGSADISNPVLHRRAGGWGSYTDPVTAAVGHTIIHGRDVLDMPAGTRLYVPSVARYFIVEDTCGDGPRPQNGPCHRLDTPGNRAPKSAAMWVDLWVGGEHATRAQSDRCMDALTRVRLIIINPRPTYRVAGGDISWHAACRIGR